MRMIVRKPQKASEQRRERLMSERTRSAALRDVFPNVDQLRIELVFNDTSANTPSPQFHTLYPAASAFFRFACPCADCDGDFDLSGPVASMMEGGLRRRRSSASSSGQLACRGVRLRDLAGQKSCLMQLNFRLTSASSPEVVKA